MTGDSRYTVRELEATELPQASQLLGRGMRDNPSNIRAFGISDLEHRSRVLTRFFAGVLRGLNQRGSILGAFRNGRLVGVSAVARPGQCQPTAREKFTLAPALIFGSPLGATARVWRWTGEWARRDPPEPHWHLGPVAVDSDVRGQGIGTAMLQDFCAHMDALSACSYLETDKSQNVRFYERFGFTVIAQAKVLGVPNWFMSRPASATKTAQALACRL